MRHNEYLLDKSYFEKVAALFNKGQSDPQKILVVEHAVINSLDFIDYLCEHYEVYFIPKPKSVDRKVLKHLSKTCTILDVSRKEFGLKSIFETDFKRHSEPRLPSTAQINH